jgi:hypothetical protein
MQPERMQLKRQPAPRPRAGAPIPERMAVPGTADAGRRSRAMPFVYGLVLVGALALGAMATGFVQVPGFDSGTVAPATSVTQSSPQQIDEGDHTVGGRFWTVTPELVQARGLTRTSGVVVIQAFGNSPLERAGVRTNDVVVAIDGIPIRAHDQLVSKIRLTPIGQQLTFTLDRGGAAEIHSVTIGRCLVREAQKLPGVPAACQSWTQ